MAYPVLVEDFQEAYSMIVRTIVTRLHGSNTGAQRGPVTEGARYGPSSATRVLFSFKAGKPETGAKRPRNLGGSSRPWEYVTSGTGSRPRRRKLR